MSLGLSKSPALGQLALSQDQAKKNLRAIILRMLQTHQLGRRAVQDRKLEVWIVASTAGGTGEGTHRIVAQEIISILKKDNPQGLSLQLNFVRIGPMTYGSVGEMDRTSLNTFFGVAADTAFSLSVVEFEQRISITPSWYYMDLPDVGAGPRNKEPRAKLVEIAVKTLMLPMVDTALGLIRNNNKNGTYLIRAGFWGHDFDSKSMYAVTLEELRDKLKAFIGVTDKKIDQVEFVRSDDFEAVEARLRDATAIQSLIENPKAPWKFAPQYNGRVLSTGELDSWLLTWADNLTAMLGDRRKVFNLDARYEIGSQDTTGRRIALEISTASKDEQKYSSEWFERIEHIRRIQKVCSELLEDLEPELRRLAVACTDAQYGQPGLFGVRPGNFMRSTKDAVQELVTSGLLSNFFVALEKVYYLRKRKQEADSYLLKEVSGEGTGPTKLLNHVLKQLEFNRRTGVGTSSKSVISAELADILDPLELLTWMQLLMTSIEAGAPPERFESEVVRGAVGLTEMGLTEVMGLPRGTSPSAIYNTLFTERGDPAYAAEWWHGDNPPDWTEHTNDQSATEFRVLPRLEPKFGKLLENVEAAKAKNYEPTVSRKEPPPGVIGLNVVAFEAAKIDDDIVLAAKHLMFPFTNMVETALADWRRNPNPRPGEESGKVTIARSGGFDGSILKQALLKAGLISNDLSLIEQFFELYDHQETQVDATPSDASLNGKPQRPVKSRPVKHVAAKP